MKVTCVVLMSDKRGWRKRGRNKKSPDKDPTPKIDQNVSSSSSASKSSSTNALGVLPENNLIRAGNHNANSSLSRNKSQFTDIPPKVEQISDTGVVDKSVLESAGEVGAVQGSPISGRGEEATEREQQNGEVGERLASPSHEISEVLTLYSNSPEAENDGVISTQSPSSLSSNMQVSTSAPKSPNHSPPKFMNSHPSPASQRSPTRIPPNVPPKGVSTSQNLPNSPTSARATRRPPPDSPTSPMMYRYQPLGSRSQHSLGSPTSPGSPTSGHTIPPPLPLPKSYPPPKSNIPASPSLPIRLPTSRSSNFTVKAQIETPPESNFKSWPGSPANDKKISNIPEKNTTTSLDKSDISYNNRTNSVNEKPALSVATTLAPVENLIRNSQIKHIPTSVNNFNNNSENSVTSVPKSNSVYNQFNSNSLVPHSNIPSNSKSYNTIATDKMEPNSSSGNDKNRESRKMAAGNMDSITDVHSAGKPLSRQPSLSRSRSDEALAGYRMKKVAVRDREDRPSQDSQPDEALNASFDSEVAKNDIGDNKLRGQSSSGNHSPGSSSVASLMSSATVITHTGAAPLDSAHMRGAQKHTLGEILKHIDLKSTALMDQSDFTHATTLPDLTFLAHQSRYSADPQIKRRLMSRLSEAHVVEIFIRVFKSVITVDYLKTPENPLLAEGTQSGISPRGTAAGGSSIEGGANWGMPPPHPSARIQSHDSPRGPMSPRQRPLDMMSEPGMDNRSLLSERLHNVPNSMKNLRAALTLLVNTSEKSNTVCDQCLRYGVVSMLFQELSDQQFHGSEAMRDQNRMYLVKGYLGILLNVIKHQPDARDAFRDAGAVKVLQQYLKSSLLMVKTRTLLLLSYVIGEAENDVINSTERHLTLLVKMLQGALEVEGHFSKKYGLHAAEMAAAINRYASCDSNKPRLVRRGALALYTQLMKPPSSEEEQMLGAKGLWSLAFSEENRTVIQQDVPCLQALERLESSSHREEIRKTASGALWVIQEHHIPVRPIGKAYLPSSDQVPDGDQHVLISYQWGAKALVFKIKERLRAAGYKVCTDVENTDIPIMDGMAMAVAQAAVVLLCMSHRFKESPSCRTEAEYAWHGGRPLIPLKLQQHYSPEGWLLPLVDSRMTFDLSTEDNLDTLLPNVVREIGNRGRARAIEQFDLLLGGSSSSLPKPQDACTQTVDVRNAVAVWSAEDVGRWLKHHDLSNLTDKLKHVNGDLLLEIRKMQKEAPESFYSTIKNELKMNFLAVLKFTRALDTLDHL